MLDYVCSIGGCFGENVRRSKTSKSHEKPPWLCANSLLRRSFLCPKWQNTYRVVADCYIPFYYSPTYYVSNDMRRTLHLSKMPCYGCYAVHQGGGAAVLIGTKHFPPWSEITFHSIPKWEWNLKSTLPRWCTWVTISETRFGWYKYGKWSRNF